MKKISAYLLLLSLLIISVSACSKTSDPATSPVETTLSIQLRADAGDGRVILDWQMKGAAKTYNIYYLTSPSYSSTNRPSIATMKKDGTKITGVISATYAVGAHAGEVLANGTTYWFAISYLDFSANESDLSSAIYSIPTSSVPLEAPENVRANAGDARVTVTWDTVAGADHYLLYCYWTDRLNAGVGTIDGIAGTLGRQIVDSTTINWTVGEDVGVTPNPGLKNDRLYSFWIEALTTINVSSTPSFVVWATPSATPPPFAPVLTGAIAGDQEITVQWNIPETGAPDHYIIYIGEAKGVTKSSGAPTSVTPSTPLEAIASGLTNGNTYYMVVTAVYVDGRESAESNEMSATPGP